MLLQVLYFAMAANEDWATVPSAALKTPEDIKTFVLLFLIPNGIWIVVPALVCWTLGKQLAAATAKVSA